MLGVCREPHQVHHVDDPDLHIGEVVTDDSHSSQGLQGGRVAAAGHDDVGLLALII